MADEPDERQIFLAEFPQPAGLAPKPHAKPSELPSPHAGHRDRLRARFNVAVAELDHQDLWQRAVVGVVSIASDRKVLEKILRTVEEESHNVLGRELVGTESEIF